MDISFTKSFIVLIPLSLIGISLVKRIVTEKRAEVIIPLGIITGVTTYIFFLNLFSYLIDGFWGIMLSFLIFLAIVYQITIHFPSHKLDFPKNKASILWKASMIFWGLFLYLPISHRLLEAEDFMYYSIGKTFAKGNFPILSPWQPDLYVAYHYGASIFIGAINALTEVHMDQLHRLTPMILIFCIIQLLIYGFKRHENFKSLLLYQIVAFTGLISCGSIMLIWPIFPLQLPIFTNHENLIDWIRQWPNMSATMDSYGMPSRLELIYNQMQHAFGLASFFLVFFIALSGKLKTKLFWIILFANLSALSFINESIFPSAIAVSFFILYFKLNKKPNLLNWQNGKLVFFFLLIGVFVLFQGGMITDNLFRNKNIESGLAFTKISQIPEKFHYFQDKVFQILPENTSWLPFRWSHIDYLIMYPLALILLFLLKKVFRKNISTTILSLMLAAIVPNLLYFAIIVKFLPSDGNRLLSFTYIFLGIALALEIVFLLEQIYQKKKIYAVLLILVVLWIFIPSNLPSVFDFWHNLYTSDYFFQPQYKTVPPLNIWVDDNIKINNRILDLASPIYYISENSKFYDGIIKPLPPYSGTLSPYWDNKYQAFMYEVGPDYLNLLYTLNPSTIKKLKLDYLVIDRQYFQTLPKIRQDELNNGNYFNKVFTDDKTISNYWISVYQIKNAYLQQGSNIDQTVDELDKIIPQKSIVYIDKEFKPYSWLNIRNAIYITLKDRDLVFNQQGMGGYGFLGTKFTSRFPKPSDKYDFLILKKETSPKTICSCKVEKIWEGYRGKAIGWKVISQ